MEIRDISKQSNVPDLNKPDEFTEIITGDPSMLKILKEAELHAQSNVPILISDLKL